MAAPSQIKQMGHAGVVVMAPETTAPPLPGVNTTPEAAPTDFQIVGYTDLPDFNEDRGAQGVKSASAFQEVDAYQTQREYSLGGTITLAANVLTNTFLGAALRQQTEATAESWPSTVMGQALFCLGTGFISDWDEGSLTLGRYTQFKSIALTAREKQAVTMDYEVWPHFCQSGTPLSSLVGVDEEGQSLFHEALVWNRLRFTIGTDPYRHVIAGVNINVDNNTVREGVRDIATSTPEILRLTPEWVKPGTQTSTMSLELHTETADALKQRDIGTIIMEADGYYGSELRTLRATIPNATFSSGARNRANPDDPIRYGVNYLARYVSVGWVQE